MSLKLYIVCATLSCLFFFIANAQDGRRSLRIPRTRFSCHGRPSGYYADVDTGCQVYHMCDGLGRQFSYECPNTTLFQQRMLICDHWYMVNCSKSEADYDANLLIGQRDKPFVSEADMQQRTPRPDILSVPPSNSYYEGLKEAESKHPLQSGNSILGSVDSININNGLDSAKPNFRPPTSWSTGTGHHNHNTSPRPNQQFNQHIDDDNLTGAASQGPGPTFQPTPAKDVTHNTGIPNSSTPSNNLRPPKRPATSTTEEPSSEEFDLDVRMEDKDPVVDFIKRFDPNSPDSIKTSMTKTEIINLNKQLPDAQASAEDERTSRHNKNFGNSLNTVENEKTKGVTTSSRFNTANIKPEQNDFSNADDLQSIQIPVPNKFLLPPKTDETLHRSTTVGPPVYYEWKWAVPAFDLEPPKLKNTSENNLSQVNTVLKPGRSPFSDVTRPPQRDLEPVAPTKNTEYNISSYLVPDYVFPLDNSHPGYEEDNAETSFLVKVGRPGRASYGENPACPHCHPAYLEPGKCEPCIVQR